MKKLIFQKFIKDSLGKFVIITLSLSFIVWVIQAVNFLDFVSKDGHGLKTYFAYSLLNFPKIVHRILPFTFFISLFYQIYRYEERNELLVFWTNGINKINFINIILLYTLVITVLQVVLGSYISPEGQSKAKTYLRDSNIDFLPALIKEGKFIDTVSDLTIFIGSKGLDGSYNNIFLNDATAQKGSQTIYAKKGKLINEVNSRYFELYDGNIINNDGQNTTNISFQKIDFNLFSSNTTTYPKIQEINSYTLYECIRLSFKKDFNKFVKDQFRCELSSINSVRKEFLKRFYKPIYFPLITLICCLLIIKSKESSSYQRHKLTVFLLSFSTIVISEVSLRYVTQNDIGVLFFFLFPVLFFLLLYIFLLSKFRSVA